MVYININAHYSIFIVVRKNVTHNFKILKTIPNATDIFNDQRMNMCNVLKSSFFSLCYSPNS